jgi:dihydrofolate synthase/folylpolyglutamate synthase
MTPSLPHWPVHTGTASKDSIATMHAILELLGNPQNKLTNVIHIGGTNGKGSTIAFTASLLRSSGKTVNVHTSPHILDFCERFSLNGQNAKKDDVFFALEEVRAVCEKYNSGETQKLTPTILEATTVACFLLFVKFPADYNIIEVCMGGKLDCTNVSYQSLICTAITSISLDHTKFLGSTIPEIALHKAGIQREGVPSIIAKQKESDASLLLFNYAIKFNIPASFYGSDYTISTIEFDETLPNDAQILYQDENHELFLPLPSLRGAHQLENLATALRICSTIGTDLTNAKTAVTKTQWIGRLQTVQNLHFPQNMNFWFDGAHNQGGAEVLCNWILQTQRHEIADYIIIGKSKGANQVDFISQFKNSNAVLVFVTVRGEIYPETSSNLCEFAKSIGVYSVEGKNISHTISHILPKDKQIRIIGCGSLYLLKDLNYYTFP